MTAESTRSPILETCSLEVAFPTPTGWRAAVDSVSLRLSRGDRVGLVGESGSGKSVLALACLGLVASPGSIRGGRVLVGGSDLASASTEELRRVRGGVVGLVLQEPLSVLNPVYSVGFQLVEAIRTHRRLDRAGARALAAQRLAELSLDEPEAVLAAYPHQLSGGQAQRVLLAIALAGDPELLIADEPTTALDVTTQAEVLHLIDRLCTSRGMALLLVSHDLAVVSGMVDRVVVMLAGECVEEGPTDELLRRPLHPFTRDLIGSSPGAPLDDVGSVATGGHGPGCRYAARCTIAAPSCRTHHPGLAEASPTHRTRCPVTLHGSTA